MPLKRRNGGNALVKSRVKIGGSPTSPVPYDKLKLSNPRVRISSGDWIYDMKNKKNNKVEKVRITEKLKQDGKKMIKFQTVYQVLDNSLLAGVSGSFEGYTPYHDHTGPWTYITPYDEVVLTKHISPGKTLKLASIGVFGLGSRKKKTHRNPRKNKRTKRKTKRTKRTKSRRRTRRRRRN